MLIDNNLTFSGSWSAGTWTAQDVKGNGTTVVSTNVLDTNPSGTGAGANQPIDLGAGEPLYIVSDVTVAAAGGTSVEIQYVEADDTGLSTNATVLASSGAIPVASLPIGAQVVIAVPRASQYATRRYVGIKYVNVGNNTAISVITNMVKNVPDFGANAIYKVGFSVK